MVRIAIAAFLALSAVTLNAECGSLEHTSEPEQIRALIVKIQKEPSAENRSAHAEALADILQKLYKTKTIAHQINGRTVADLANLLEDDSDAVRSGVAASLGFVGPSAHAAVPSLKRALSRIVHEKSSSREAVAILKTSDSEWPIRLALERITGRPRETFPPFVHSDFQKLR